MTAGIVQENTMTAKKESVEINCTGCDTAFRLWIPVESMDEWTKGVRINCIRCGAEHFVRRTAEGFEVRAAAEAPQPAVAAAPRQAQAAQPSVEQVEPEPAPEPQPAPPAAVETDTREKVLFIEDDRLAREMAENTMKDTGINLRMAGNSTDALRIIDEEDIKLIVTDLYLKGPNAPDTEIDGEDLLKRLVDSGRQIPAIITTGKDIIDDLVLDPKWFDLHVKGFIQKGNPFWVEELKLKVKEVLYKD